MQSTTSVGEAYVDLASEEAGADVPSSLFHTTLTVIKDPADSGCSVSTVYPLGTHATLRAAKDFSSKALQGLGYYPSDFELYEERPKTPEPDAETWPYSDGTMIHAKRPGPCEFLISIMTTPNNEQLSVNPDKPSELELPGGTDHLHYVMQTKVDYNSQRIGAAQDTEIEGVYVKRADAFAAAKACLISDEIPREDYAQYDEWDSETLKDEWPFGEDVVVHAVSQTGENYTVAIRTVIGSHSKHAKKH
jgi:hypothetical protein